MRQTPFTEWLGTLSGFNATTVNRLWRILAAIFPAYCLLLVIGNICSSTGFGFMNWWFLFTWEVLAIAVLVSPYLWEGVTVLGLGKEVLGGEEGFEFEHWFTRFRHYSRKFLTFWTMYVLIWPSVGMVYLALSDTSGTFWLHLVILILSPLVIFYSAYRWPGSETAFRTIGGLIIIVYSVAIGLGAYNTVQRRLLDPATRTVLEANEAIEEARQAADKKRAESIHQTLRAGHKLSAEDQKFWDALQTRMQQQGPFERFKSLWQSPAQKAQELAKAGAQAEMSNRWNKRSQDCYLAAQAPNKVLLPGDLDRCSVEFLMRQEQCSRQVQEAAAKASEPTKESDLEQCRKTGSWTATPVARSASTPAHERAEFIEPVTRPTKTAATDPKDWTCTAFKEFDYDPQNHFRLKIETGPGRYEVDFGSRMRKHVFQRNIKDEKERLTDSLEWYAVCLIDADGKTHDCTKRQGEATGNPWPDFSVKHEDVSRWIDRPLMVPIPTEPYGKVIVRTAENRVVSIGSKGRFETKGDSFVLDLNVDPFPTNYQGYGLKGTLRRCEAN